MALLNEIMVREDEKHKHFRHIFVPLNMCNQGINLIDLYQIILTGSDNNRVQKMNTIVLWTDNRSDSRW